MTYQSKLPLYEHQRLTLEKLGGKKVAGYLLAMRTGKSCVLLTDFGTLESEGKVRDLLVLAPGGVYRTWEGAIKDHVSDDLQSRLLVYTWQSGSSKGQRAVLNEFLKYTDRPRIMLMNIEALSRAGEAREVSEEFLKQRPQMNMAAIDEVTCVKGATLRTKFVNTVLRPLAAYRRILSGLPTPRSPLDLYHEFYFLDPAILGHRSFFTFRNRYAVVKQEWFGGRRVPVVVGYQNQDELRQLIAPHSYRVEFRPKIPSTYSIRTVELSKEQRRIYDEIKQFATSKIEGESHVTATVVIAQIMRLHQVLCGHVRDEQGNLHEIPENRTKELLEILDDFSGKAIIWANYDHDIKKIGKAVCDEYGAGSCARFWGGNTNTREEEERQFKTDPKCRFMVATPDAGRFGRTWDNADLVIFYSSKNDLDHREQAEQRPLGVNKDRGVDYIDLLCKQVPLEMKNLENLRNKIDMASTLQGDKWREWIV